MGKLARSTGAGAAIGLVLGVLAKKFTKKWYIMSGAVSTEQRKRKRRPRVPRAELAAAYERAAKDPAFLGEMAAVDSAWDCTTSDGLTEHAQPA